MEKPDKVTRFSFIVVLASFDLCDSQAVVTVPEARKDEHLSQALSGLTDSRY
jgi:hypothetical protein